MAVEELGVDTMTAQRIWEAAKETLEATPVAKGPHVVAPDGTAYGGEVAGGTGPELVLPKKIDPTMLLALLTELQQKQMELGIKGSENDIKDRQIAKDIKHKEVRQKLVKASKGPGPGKLIAKIFGWIGAAVAIIAAAVAVVVTGGAAAAAMVAVAALTVGVMVLQETGAMNKMMDSMHMSDKAKMIFNMTLAAVMLVINIAMIVVTGGASMVGAGANAVKSLFGVGSSAAETAATAAETAAGVAEVASTAAEAASSGAEGASAAASAAESASAAAELTSSVAEDASAGAEAAASAAETATSSSSKVADIGQKVFGALKIAGGASSVTAGGAAVGESVQQHDIALARADAMKEKAEVARLIAMNDRDMQVIEELIKMVQDGMVRLAGAVDTEHQTMMRVSANMA